MWRSFAIVPAAGRSRRMGQPKLLMPWGSGTLLEQTLRAWRGSGVQQTVLVVHGDDRQLAQLGRNAGVDVQVAALPPPDMKASIGIGLAAVASQWQPTAADCWLLAPADLPLLESRTIDAVLAAHDPAQPTIVAPCDSAGKRSHPVLFPWPLAAEVAHLAADEGLRTLLERFPVREVTIPWLIASADVDTLEDYRRLRNRYDPCEQRSDPG